MNLEHPLDFNDSFWDPIKALTLPFIQGDGWEERKQELCWSRGEYPELCNHQLLNHFSNQNEEIPEDYVMNAITVNEI